MARTWIAPLAALAMMSLLTASAALSEDWGDNKDDFTSGPEYEASKAMCRQVKGLTIPPGDRPTAAEAKALKGCDSEALYYGIGMKADPVKARQCAILEADKGSDELFSGETMLMTIYANGLGVKRNLDLAIHYACRIEGAPAEMQGRIEHLAAMKTATAPETFHFCQDVTSGLAMGYCAAHMERVDKAERERKIAGISARYTPTQKAALTALLAARKAWITAGDDEVDLSGTARAALVIDAEARHDDEFLELLTLVSNGGLPAVGAAGAKAADAELNSVYGRVMKADEADFGTVKKTDIRNVQRAWIRYRDAWIAFAKAAFPAASPDSVAAWLTKKRTEDLKSLIGEGTEDRL